MKIQEYNSDWSCRTFLVGTNHWRSLNLRDTEDKIVILDIPSGYLLCTLSLIITIYQGRDDKRPKPSVIN